MGHWGVKSYENDDAGDALDAGFARVHGATYEDLMDDANPLTPEQVQQRLAGPETLAAVARGPGRRASAGPTDEWDEVARLAYAGVVVRHAELGVPIPADVRSLRPRRSSATSRSTGRRRPPADSAATRKSGSSNRRPDPDRRAPMPERRTLEFVRLDDVMPEVDRLLAGYTSAGNWSLGQICKHLSSTIRSSVEGFGVKAPWIFRATLGPVVKKKILGDGRMAEGIKVPGKLLPTTGLDDRAEAEALRASIAYYMAHPEARAPHPFFGRMTGAEYDRLHLRPLRPSPELRPARLGGTTALSRATGAPAA